MQGSGEKKQNWRGKMRVFAEKRKIGEEKIRFFS
jgi:hypothetical protein